MYDVIRIDKYNSFDSISVLRQATHDEVNISHRKTGLGVVLKHTSLLHRANLVQKIGSGKCIMYDFD